MSAPEAILARLNPRGLFEPCEYLQRVEDLLQEDRWVWGCDQAAAFRFPGHEQASRAREQHAYEDAAGKRHEPFALVVSAPDAEEPELAEARASTRSAKTIEERSAIGRRASHTHFVRKRAALTAQESYEMLEKRGLA